LRQEKLLAVGEAHLALVPEEAYESLKEANEYIREPGGSPVNVSRAATKWGARVEYAGKLGKDPFGDYLARLLPECEIGTSYLSQTHLAPTRVLFRSQADGGERLLIQSSSADRLLRPDDIEKDWIDYGDITYFSSQPLSQSPSRGAIEKLVNIAGEKGAIVAFAPQVNLDEWPNETLARETILYNIPYAHILIISEEELKFFTEKEDEFLAIKKLFSGKTKCMIIMRGNKGITYVTERDKGNIRYAMEDIVDPAGMDDAFIGYLLSDLLKQQVTADQLTGYLMDAFSLEERLVKALDYRYKTARKRGSFFAMTDGNGLSASLS